MSTNGNISPEQGVAESLTESSADAGSTASGVPSRMTDLELLRSTPLQVEPFEYCIVRNFIDAESLERIERDFPDIQQGGSFPVESLSYGPHFRQLVDELLSEETKQAFADHFSIDLSGRPATLTVRGNSRQKDGRIHTDSKTKLITVLLYLNRSWQSEGGRLRLLRSGTDMDDVIAEVSPDAGTLVAFRCRENAWHGHKPFNGVRRALQLNWVVDEAAARRSRRTHGWSAVFKKLFK